MESPVREISWIFKDDWLIECSRVFEFRGVEIWEDDNTKVFESDKFIDLEISWLKYSGFYS